MTGIDGGGVFGSQLASTPLYANRRNALKVDFGLFASPVGKPDLGPSSLPST